MKLLTTLALLSTAILANAATIPAQLASSLESRKSCNTPGSGKNYCGGGRECGDGPGIVSSPFPLLYLCTSTSTALYSIDR